MSILLPLLAFILLFLIFNQANCWRSSLLYSSIVWGFVLALLTEILSLFKTIILLNLSLAWFAVDTSLLSFICFHKIYLGSGLKLDFVGEHPQNQALNQTLELPNFRTVRKAALRQLDLDTRLSIASILFVILGVGLIAIIAPPNTWDAMNYHMSRVMHWMQNGSLAHYPTSYEPQLYQSPFTELIILNFYILSGGDYFANAVQWISMIGCVVGTSLMAKQIDGSLRSQLLAALISVTIPIGILEASSVKNDYLLAFWLLCIANIMLELHNKSLDSERVISLSVLLSISLGLALLTKGTANIYSLPFIIYGCWIIFRKLKEAFWKPLPLMVASVALINLGYYVRNFSLYYSLLGPLREGQNSASYKSEVLHPLALISNLLRNIGSNLGTPIGFLNQQTYGLINKFHTLMGLDINDSRTTFSGDFYVPGGWSSLGFYGNEDNASNTIICILTLLAAVIFCFNKELRKNRDLTVYLALVSSSFLLFCLLVKWQIWITRLQLPIFILFSVFTGVVFAKALNRKQLIVLTIMLAISALPWVTLNRYRPMIGSNNIFQVARSEQYFARQPSLSQPYREAANFLKAKSCAKIGLELNDPYEYPLWASLQAAKITPLQIQHVNVKDFSSALSLKAEFNTFMPCAIFHLAGQDQQDETIPSSIDYQGESYMHQWEMGRVSIFMPKAQYNTPDTFFQTRL
jgi:hypothetical protein